MCEAAVISGHTYIHTHIHTYTHDNYYNPRCAHAHRGLITKEVVAEALLEMNQEVDIQRASIESYR